MADRKVIQFTGTDGNDYDVRDEAAQQMIGTTALPTTAQTLTGAIAEHETDLGTKADKVASAVNGNFAGLDGNGNLTDSGSKASDFVPVDREINGKAMSSDVTLTGNDITVSAEDERTVSDAIESKADQIHAEVDGYSAVMSITDGADNVPMGMQIAIEPVQDLHGETSPYPAGAGINLFDKDGTIEDGYINDSTGGITYNSSYKCTDFIEVTAGATYYIKTEQTASTWGAWYDENKAYISGITNYANTTNTAPNNAKYARFTIVAGNGTGSVDTFCVNYPATETGYHRYSNICPITGWTGAEITRTGKNLCDYDEIDVIYVKSDVQRLGVELKLPAGIYTVSASAHDNTTNVFARLHLADGTYTTAYSIIANHSSHSNVQYTIENGDGLILYYYENTTTDITGAKASFANAKIMVERGSIKTDYEECSKDVYSITFPSQAGTVYSGTLTVNEDGTGEIVEDAVKFQFTSSNYSDVTGDRMRMNYPSTPALYKNAAGLVACESLKVADSSTTDCAINFGGSKVFVRIDSVYAQGASAYSEWLSDNPITVVAKLATPVTYTLTAPVIRSLLGANNVWADTGNVLHLDYTADTKSYIDKTDNRITSILNAMVAPVLPSMVADTALSVNDFRIVNDTLYRVTASIASGGTLTVGTNVVKTSIGEQITALLNAN